MEESVKTIHETIHETVENRTPFTIAILGELDAGGELPDSSMESGWNLWRNLWRVKPHGRLGCVNNPSNTSRYWKCSAKIPL